MQLESEVEELRAQNRALNADIDGKQADTMGQVEIMRGLLAGVLHDMTAFARQHPEAAETLSASDAIRNAHRVVSSLS